MPYSEILRVSDLFSNCALFSCLCADVVAYAAKKTYLEFIEQAGELNDLDHYPMLVKCCKEIGFSVLKVVFRGYYAHNKLQQMHDKAIAKRTELNLLVSFFCVCLRTL